MKEAVDGDESKIASTWCSVVADNTMVNPAAARMLEREHPTIFFNGCRAHFADLLIEQLAKIKEFDLFIADCSMMIKFILNHSKVKEAYKRIAKELKKGTMVKLFSETRFAHIALMLDSLLGDDDCNIDIMRAMILEDKWERGTCAGINAGEIEAFRTLVQDTDFIAKVKCLSQLFSIASAYVHHQETPGIRASFILPLYKALERDVEVWIEKKGRNNFMAPTMASIRDCIRVRWIGVPRQNLIGIYAPQYLMAWILDPVMSPEREVLPQCWKADCGSIVKRFYPEGPDRLAAMSELRSCILRENTFGEELELAQKELGKMSGLPPAVGTLGHVAHEIKRQKVALQSTDPVQLWKLDIGPTCPKLCDIALRLLMMGTQSADVERACKANKLVHTKVRNRLSNKNVKMLLFCYRNLRVLKKDIADGGERLDAEHLMEGFLNDALLEELAEPDNDSCTA